MNATANKTKKTIKRALVSRPAPAKKTSDARSMTRKTRTAKNSSLLDRIELFTVPSNGKMDRLVEAKMGKNSYTDTFDIYKVPGRGIAFVRALPNSSRFRLKNSVVWISVSRRRLPR